MENTLHLNRERIINLSLRVLATLLVLALWILIDKGNVYGQSNQRATNVVKVGANGLTTDDGSRGGGKPGDGTSGDDLVIYPNPTKDILVFDFEFTVRGGSTSPCQILDALGRTVFSGNIDNDGGLPKLNLGHLHPGLYMAVVEIAGKPVVRRFIKE